MIEVNTPANTPANTTEALNIINAMVKGEMVANVGGDAHRPAEVLALIGDSFMFYTKAYCAMAHRMDGLFQSEDFSKGTPFYLEDMSTGKLTPINSMSVGAEQLMQALAH